MEKSCELCHQFKQGKCTNFDASCRCRFQYLGIQAASSCDEFLCINTFEIKCPDGMAIIPFHLTNTVWGNFGKLVYIKTSAGRVMSATLPIHVDTFDANAIMSYLCTLNSQSKIYDCLMTMIIGGEQ